MTDHAHKFTANYANGSVTLAGKTFPAGQFVVEAINAWMQTDFPMQSGVWEKVLQSEIAHGRIDEQLFARQRKMCAFAVGKSVRSHRIPICVMPRKNCS